MAVRRVVIDDDDKPKDKNFIPGLTDQYTTKMPKKESSDILSLAQLREIWEERERNDA